MHRARTPCFHSVLPKSLLIKKPTVNQLLSLAEKQISFGNGNAHALRAPPHHAFPTRKGEFRPQNIGFSFKKVLLKINI